MSNQALWVSSGRIEQPETAQLALGRARSDLRSPTVGPDLSRKPSYQIGQTPEMGQAVHQSQAAGQRRKIGPTENRSRHPHRKLTVVCMSSAKWIANCKPIECPTVINFNCVCRGHHEREISPGPQPSTLISGRQQLDCDYGCRGQIGKRNANPHQRTRRFLVSER